MTAPQSKPPKNIVIKLVGIFFCGMLALGVQQQPICSWLQGLTLLVADHENIDRLKNCTRKRLQKIERRRKLKKREK